MRALHSRRGGFTLVELLVAVGIILVLAGLALLVANSGIIGNARTSSGSDRIAGWLMQARAKAQRNGSPVGLRFSIGPDGFIREAQQIEVPEPYSMPTGYILMIENSPGGRHIYVVPTAGGNAVTELNNNVSIGDTLSIPGTGTIHRIATIQAANVTVAGNVVVAAEIIPAQPALIPDIGAAASTVAGTPTYNAGVFGFIRQARATFGEPPYQIPDTVAIDPTNCLIDPNPLTGTLDILFSPSGEVLHAGSRGQIVLWTRNPEAMAANPRNPTGLPANQDLRSNYELAGEMRLIVVYSKTGAVAVQQVAMPVDETAATTHDPYANAKDGIASGL
jgi:prepilin-type N-terminal cleavage/methylation domain-containing protein